MMKIELVKFEAQDVITASGCAHTNLKFDITAGANGLTFSDATCNACGETGKFVKVENGTPVYDFKK